MTPPLDERPFAEDDLIFDDEDDQINEQVDSTQTWKIMLVDDDEEVHQVIKLALHPFTFEGRGLTFLSAMSGEEAQTLIKQHPDTALMLLEVVMETNDAGLKVVQYIRDVLDNKWVRIILRTGQPGEAPEESMLLSYDINDYKTKDELTRSKLLPTVASSLRSYRHLTMIEQTLAESADLQANLQEKNKALFEARKTAEAANRTKNTFLVNIGHEFRTPLNVIIGYSELLYEETQKQGLETFTVCLSYILNAGNQLTGMVNEILDLAKYEMGTMELELTRFDLTSLLEEIIVIVRPWAEKNGNHLSVQIAKELGSLYADQRKLRHILLNLLNNAAKFTKGGKIALVAKREAPKTKMIEAQAGTNQPNSANPTFQDWVSFTITDTGIGMSPAQTTDIFDMFTQVDSSMTRRFEGAGLGLALSQRLCRLMGGEITVQSELGRGSTFTVRLPAGSCSLTSQ